MHLLVIALGGNAILPPGDPGDLDAMRERIERFGATVADLADGDVRLAITHGNGPQVGNLLMQAEEARAKVPPLPLDVLVAESQAQIGYLLQQTLQNAFARRGRVPGVASVVTQVVVDAGDPAFGEPTKPVGPVITSETDVMLKRAKGWRLREDRGGWRRVVASPRPLEIVEVAAVRALLEAGLVVIAAGGGGVPVVREGGNLVGVEAVVDKDLATAVLATALGAERLVLATDVDRVALNFKKSDARFLDGMTVDEARRHLKEGHFPPGSMGPKVEAAVDFVTGGGREAIITSMAHIQDGLDGTAGTRITA